MIVRRTPDKRIKIVHVATGDVFEMRLLNVDNEGPDGNPRIHVETDYRPAQYSAQARRFEMCPEWPGSIYLQRGGEIILRHSSGNDMSIQAIRVSGKDVDFRLHDPTRRFEFLWSDHRLTG